MISKRNFSAKREAIYQSLVNTKTHPSAEWIYDRLKPDLPDLSLGTVYRNLAIFKETGLARSVGIVNGQERFDADMSVHSHFICKKCFCINDIHRGRSIVDSSIYTYLEREYGFRIEGHNITYYGLCKKCSENADD